MSSEASGSGNAGARASDGAGSPTAGRGEVQSVARALGLLEIVHRAGGHASIGAIQAEAGIPLPTVHRLLATLVDHGYMRRLPDRHYALGLKLVPLGATAGSLIGLGAQRVLRELADELGETANLAVLAGVNAEYVAQAPSPHSMRMFTEVGRLVELHCTGVGKALLAQLSEARVEAYLSGAELGPRTEHTLTTPAAVREALAEIRTRGYALDEQEQELGVRCVAVTVPSAVPAAVSVSGPLTRLTDPLIARAVPALHAAAAQLALTLDP